MQPIYISYLGWNALPRAQGQFRIDEESMQKVVDRENGRRRRHNESRNTSLQYSMVTDKYFIKDIHKRSFNSLIPGVNVINGLWLMFYSIFCSNTNLLVVKEHIIPCRLLLFTVGLLEITWIGGVIIHSMASLYFFTFKGLKNPRLVIK